MKKVVGPQIWSVRGEPLMIQIITFRISAKTVKRLRKIQDKTELHNNLQRHFLELYNQSTLHVDACMDFVSSDPLTVYSKFPVKIV